MIIGYESWQRNENDHNPSVLNNTIPQLRKEKGVTQEELANAVGVTRQTIIAIEKGNYVPSLLLGLRIASYFNSPVESVFSYEKAQ